MAGILVLVERVQQRMFEEGEGEGRRKKGHVDPPAGLLRVGLCVGWPLRAKTRQSGYDPTFQQFI